MGTRQNKNRSTWAKWGQLACVCLCLLGCGGEPRPEAKPTTTPIVDDNDQVFPLDGDYAASHILVTFHGAQDAPAEIRRSQTEAEVRARDLLTRVLADPSQFETLARTTSEGPSAGMGGRLGAWRKGEFLAELETTLYQLTIGQIHNQPVKTDYGFHILRRDPLMAKHYAASGLIIGYKGHPQNPPEIVRSAEEALALATTLAPTLTASTFEQLAAQHNDVGEGPQFMGVMRPGDTLPAGVLDGLEKVAYGEVIGPFQFPMGYVFLRREKVVNCQGSTSILIAFEGAIGASPSIDRSKDAAKAEASRLIQELTKDPAQFEELAKHHNDMPAPEEGKLGPGAFCQMDPAFRKAFDFLKEGSITAEPVETKYGYFIIRRGIPNKTE